MADSEFQVSLTARQVTHLPSRIVFSVIEHDNGFELVGDPATVPKPLEDATFYAALATRAGQAWEESL